MKLSKATMNIFYGLLTWSAVVLIAVLVFVYNFWGPPASARAEGCEGAKHYFLARCE